MIGNLSFWHLIIFILIIFPTWWFIKKEKPKKNKLINTTLKGLIVGLIIVIIMTFIPSLLVQESSFLVLWAIIGIALALYLTEKIVKNKIGKGILLTFIAMDCIALLWALIYIVLVATGILN